MAIKIRITQTKSGVGRPETQNRTLRGMIRKVSHLVTIESAD